MKDSDQDPSQPGADSGESFDSAQSDSGSLRNQFLIATPNLDAGIFKSSVAYICEHNEEGAMGIIINRPSTMCVDDILADVFSDEQQDATGSDEPTADSVEHENKSLVLVGGPVGLERGFVLHESPEESPWRSSLQVTSDIALTGSRDILQAMKEGKGPDNYLVVLGYAGWSPGQLEQELAENAWISVPASSEILFATPFHERAKAACASLGIDLAALATTAGNA